MLEFSTNPNGYYNVLVDGIILGALRQMHSDKNRYWFEPNGVSINAVELYQIVVKLKELNGSLRRGD